MTQQFLVYGTVRELYVPLGTKQPRITMSTGHTIIVERGSLQGDTVNWVADNEFQSLTLNKPYFVSCFQKHNIRGYDDKLPLFMSEAQHVFDTKQVKTMHHAMKDAAHAAVKALESLNARDRAIVLSACGITLTGSVSALSFLTAVAEVGNLIGGFTFEPTTLVTSAALSGVTGLITYVQYENLNAYLKQRADAVKRLQTAHSIYSRTMRKYIPETALNGIPLNPAVRSVIGDMSAMFDVSFTNMRRWWASDLRGATA